MDPPLSDLNSLKHCKLQVVTLMGVDLLRQQQKWKDGLMDIRQLMANLVSQVCYLIIIVYST